VTKASRILLMVLGGVFVLAMLMGLAGPVNTPKHFSVVCADEATMIRAPGGQMTYRCQNNSSTKVFVGGSDVTSSSFGGEYCNTSSCPEVSWGGDMRHEYCAVASGTVTIRCRAGGI